MTTWTATIDTNHKINAPTAIPTGAKVMVWAAPLISDLLADRARRLRFAATRRVLKEAIKQYDSSTAPSNEEIVNLVKQARTEIYQ